jgi:hypothetical protein
MVIIPHKVISLECDFTSMMRLPEVILVQFNSIRCTLIYDWFTVVYILVIETHLKSAKYLVAEGSVHGSPIFSHTYQWSCPWQSAPKPDILVVLANSMALYSSKNLVTDACSLRPVSVARFHNTYSFVRWGCYSHAHSPYWRTRYCFSSGLYPLTFVTWVVLPGAYIPHCHSTLGDQDMITSSHIKTVMQGIIIIIIIIISHVKFTTFIISWTAFVV